MISTVLVCYNSCKTPAHKLTSPHPTPSPHTQSYAHFAGRAACELCVFCLHASTKYFFVSFMGVHDTYTPSPKFSILTPKFVSLQKESHDPYLENPKENPASF